MKTECKACAKGKVYYVNDQKIKLCPKHLKFFKDVHGKGVETELEHRETIFNNSLHKIGQLMAAPLKATLDYQGIARRLISIMRQEDNVIFGAMYDADLPPHVKNTKEENQ